jgi:E3 ubiquitin-protein ligase DOA10
LKAQPAILGFHIFGILKQTIYDKKRFAPKRVLLHYFLANTHAMVNAKRRLPMNREKLIAQVKNEYSRLANDESQQHFSQTTSNMTADKYYGNLLNMVEREISTGTFDNFHSGQEIVDAVAKDKRKWLSEWS